MVRFDLHQLVQSYDIVICAANIILKVQRHLFSKFKIHLAVNGTLIVAKPFCCVRIFKFFCLLLWLFLLLKLKSQLESIHLFVQMRHLEVKLLLVKHISEST